MVHQEIYEPRISDYDQNGVMSLEAILDMAENVASHHASRVNDDVIEGSQQGIAWVLAEWVVKIVKRPVYGERMHISTWVRSAGLSATTTVRDVVMQDAEGQDRIFLCPKFVLFDRATHRPVYLSAELMQSYQPEDRECMQLDNTRLREPADFETEKSIQLRRTDMDFNGHLHNARYVSLALEALSQEVYDANQFRGFRIVYRAPLTAEETVTIRCHTEGNTSLVCFYKQDGTLCTFVEFSM